MKKFICLFLVFALLSTAAAGFCACSSREAEGDVIRIAGLKGPTSLGLLKLMSESEAGSAANSYEFTVAGSADEITPLLIKGELDMAAIPANLAATLYNNTDGAIRVLAVNTLGVLYLVTKGQSIDSWSDLKGQTVYATGKGSTPEYTLRYLLEAHGIDPDKDISLEFKSEPTEIVALLKSGENAIAMLPQPYATVALSQVEGLSLSFDLSAEWDALGTQSALITGVLVARADYIDAHPKAVQRFLAEYRASVEYVLANTEEAAALSGHFDIVAESIALKALPKCNLCFMSGDEMKQKLSAYLSVLYQQNPKAVGGKLPDEAFYY